MRKILVATHGHLADGIKSSIEILCGERDDITYINAYVGDENIDEEIEKFFTNLKLEDQAVVFTDIIGGSVNQKLVKYNDRKNLFLISGFNLAIVLELIFMQEHLNDENIEKLVDKCRNELAYIKNEKLNASENNMEDFLS